MDAVVLESILTCPACAHQERAAMPTDACRYFYECAACHVLHKPKQGDCCVFCSYGTVECPPKQVERQGGGRPECCR